jgi:predicted DNA-binding protein (MmcQ/YjbR family)
VNIESLRDYCLSLPNTTEDIQWGNDLLFRIGGKIFAAVGLESHDSSPHQLSFKCTPETFSELVEKDGIIPAPYTARYHWVALKRFDALEDAEIKRLIGASYEMVLAKLPKKIKGQLEQK